MKRHVGFAFLASALGWALAAAIPPSIPISAFGQAYPSRPINLIVPFPPGGNPDIMARALQNELSKALGQTVVVINKGGAAGTLGLIDLSRAAPDGYTVALTPNNPLTAQPHVQKLPYAMDGFRYICLSYFAPYVLIAGPQAPFKTF
jgi:tripartite-type tricarboxylate transporter receptor subunit TctC